MTMYVQQTQPDFIKAKRGTLNFTLMLLDLCQSMMDTPLMRLADYSIDALSMLCCITYRHDTEAVSIKKHK